MLKIVSEGNAIRQRRQANVCPRISALPQAKGGFPDSAAARLL
jgi:hypothetical protein